MNNYFLTLLDTLEITYIGVSAGITLLIVISLFTYFIIKSKKKTKKVVEEVPTFDNNKFYLSIGGKENVIDEKLVGSRLTLTLKDYSLVNKEELKKIGIDGIIEMSNKIIIVKENISNYLN